MACSTIKSILVFLRIYVEKAIDFAFSLYWEDKKQKVPDLDKNHIILTESATSLARKIRQRELKSEDLVKAAIERIKEVNPILNAVIEDRYEAALEDAREVDRKVATGISDEEVKRRPFLGVPFTTKESQAIKGFRLTLGLQSRKNVRATEDSEAVVRMKEAGAIPLAATNLPELLIWQETRNPVYGMTNNPHHTGRTPGGSSGAEAALTATYATAISLCSDIGGSTRMPAFYCGLFGHHPTANTTSTKGVFFRKGGEDTMFSLGFIAKHVEDLAPLTKVVAGDKAKELDLDRDVNIKDINFYYMESSNDCFVSPIEPQLKEAMKRVISKISEETKTTDHSPKPYQHEAFDHMYQLWSYWMSREPDNYQSIYHNNEQEANCVVEVVKKLLGMSNHCLSSVVRLVDLKIMPQYPEWSETITKDLKQDLFDKLGDNGVLLFPSAPHAAPYHYSLFTKPYNFSYFAMVNVLKCPATQVPLGVNSQGLPIGIQVVAAPNNDALCLSVAKYLEKEFGGAVMACKLK